MEKTRRNIYLLLLKTSVWKEVRHFSVQCILTETTWLPTLNYVMKKAHYIHYTWLYFPFVWKWHPLHVHYSYNFPDLVRLHKTTILKTILSAFNSSKFMLYIFMLINVKMPTIVGILTFNEHDKFSRAMHKAVEPVLPPAFLYSTGWLSAISRPKFSQFLSLFVSVLR